MARRGLETVPLREQPLDEALDPSVAVTALRPVEHCKNCRHRNGVDLWTFGDQRRIIFRFELAHRVIVSKNLRERDRNEVKARVWRDAAEELDRFADDAHQRRNFAGLQLLQPALLINQDLLDLDAKALENDRPGQAGTASRRPEIDLFAAQVLDRLDIGLGQDMQFGNRKT